MNTTFQDAGIACLIAAVVGGGLQAFGIRIPVLSSWPRQVLLFILGVAFVAFSHASTFNPRSHTSQSQTQPGQAAHDSTSPAPIANAQPAPKKPPTLENASLRLLYEGFADVLRQADAKGPVVRSPNNNHNTGSCPNEQGHQGGRWCISRTPVSYAVNPPMLLQNARVGCDGDGCQFANKGNATISGDRHTATGFVDNWGPALEAFLSVDVYERLTPAACGQDITERAHNNQSVVFHISKECVPMAAIELRLPGGSTKSFPVGSAAVVDENLTELPVQDHGSVVDLTYKVKW